VILNLIMLVLSLQKNWPTTSCHITKQKQCCYSAAWTWCPWSGVS